MATGRFSLSLTLGFFCILAFVVSQDTIQEKKDKLSITPQIIEGLMNNYDSHIRPPPRDDSEHTSVIVLVNAYLVQADFKDNVATIELYLRQEWSDSRLELDDPDFETLTIPTNREVWLPDTYFFNAEETVKDMDKSLIRLEHGGYVLYSQMYTLRTECEVPNGFPFDNRKICTIKLGSYSNTVDDIAYFWRKYLPITNDPDPAGAYKVMKGVTEDCTGNYSLGRYSCLEMKLIYGGCAVNAIVGVAIPSIALIFASWLHFWIHRSWSLARPLSAIMPFGIFAILLLFASLFEQDALATTGISVWLLVCLLLTFLSLLEYFLVLCLTGKSIYGKSDAESSLLEGKRYNRKGCYLDRVSRLLFPLLFILFIIIYLIAFFL